MRFELGGKGLVIPIEALPIPSEDGDLPPQTLLLPTGDFLKQDYVGLGYTHFETWCIGAAGGAGGSALGGYGYWGAKYYGGAGGGGGLHHIAGPLSDLPDATPVIVGQAGATGRDNPGEGKWTGISDYGSAAFPNEKLVVRDTGARPFIQNGVTYINADGSYVAPYTKINIFGTPVPSNYPYHSWPADWSLTDRIPDMSDIVKPNPAFITTLDGLDGGYSKFGELCEASGGKGGKRCPMFGVMYFGGFFDERWYQYNRYPEDAGVASAAHIAQGHPGGDGGEGGIGGSIVPGGGAAGGFSTMHFAPVGETNAGHYKGATGTLPQDGTWDGDIGEGGGGGFGGAFDPGQYDQNVILQHAASVNGQNGGQGSFNYGDTSKYGPRQNAVGAAPGNGGGAKFNPLLMFGGRAAGANPNGAVLIRIVKLS